MASPSAFASKRSSDDRTKTCLGFGAGSKRSRRPTFVETLRDAFPANYDTVIPDFPAIGGAGFSGYVRQISCHARF